MPNTKGDHFRQREQHVQRPRGKGERRQGSFQECKGLQMAWECGKRRLEQQVEAGNRGSYGEGPSGTLDFTL